MPHYHIFHQNLRVFGGDSTDRNDQFKRAFQRASAALGAQGRVLALGFTEVMNANSTVSPLREFAKRLEVNLKKPALFATGVTAVGGKYEYVGISLHKNFHLEIAGKVLPKSSLSDWKAYPAYPTNRSDALRALEMPDAFQADTRGLAYVGGTFLNKPMLIGFIHNNYTLGDRSTVYRNLPKMLEKIYDAHDKDWTAGPAYIGGDFNLYPDHLNSDYRVSYACDNNGDPINTTFHHPYDFWVSDEPIPNDDAQIFTQTRWENHAKLSDHAGVAVQVL